jgi:hypothetical protein
MNSVSWFVYLADALANLKSALFGILFFGIPAAIALTVGGIVIRSGDWSWVKDTDRKFWEERRKQCASAAKVAWPVVAVLVIVNIAIPSKNTMYAIAASEVGERVLKSEAAQEMASDATKALQQWIKRQIAPEAKK